MKKPAISKSLTQQLTLFYSINEECSEIFLVADKTEKAGEYSVTCEYIKYLYMYTLDD